MMNREKQKKEQKTFEYIENPEQIEGFDKIPVPEDLDQRVRAGIEEGKKRRKKIAFRKTAKVGMGMAAAPALTPWALWGGRYCCWCWRRLLFMR